MAGGCSRAADLAADGRRLAGKHEGFEHPEQAAGVGLSVQPRPHRRVQPMSPGTQSQDTSSYKTKGVVC